MPIDYAGVALVLLGVGLMVAEAFIPAFGSFVLGGATAFAVGSVMMFSGPGQALPPALVGGATLVGLMLFGVVLRLLVRARRRPVVTGTASLIGRMGTATAWSGSGGDLLVQGERWRGRATTPLRPGQAIRVVGREGLTLLVEPQEKA
jgi:membrane-bound serine protease (ClpP class)